jgi:hypothetical protein
MDERTDGQCASVLREIEAKIKGEGCSSIDELISQHHDSKANCEKAEQARDKFAEANKEAAKIIGSKGTEHGLLKQQLTEAETKIVDLTAQLEGKPNTEPGTKPPAPQPPPAPEKPVDEELAEVEGKLTKEQWAIADQLIAVEDEERAIELADNPKARLAFLKELSSSPETKTRPTAFPRTTKPTTPPPDEETHVQRLMKRLTGVTPGPSGRAAGGGAINRQPESRSDPRLH